MNTNSPNDPNQFTGLGTNPNPRWGKPRHRPNISANLIFGIIAIFAGCLLLLDRFNIVDAGLILQFWPAVLIGLGLGLIFRGPHRGLLPGLFLCGIGGVFLARNLGYTRLGFGDIWPVLLILVGVAVLVNSLRARHEPPSQNNKFHREEFLNDWAMFGGVEKIVQSQDFRGGDIFAMFGGVEINLRKAKLTAQGPAIINANAIFGGVELYVPEDWHVINEGAGIMGGYADSRKFVESDNAVTTDHQQVLIVRGVAVFGGVEIKN